MSEFRIVLLTGAPSNKLNKFKSEFIEKVVASDELNLIGIIAEKPKEFSLPYRLCRLVRKRGLFSLVLVLDYIIRLATRRWLTRESNLIDLEYFERNYNIPVFYTTSINREEVIETIKAWRPALGVIYGTSIAKPKVLNLPQKGTIGIHHGKLPEYKGPYTTAFWPLFNGEKETGVTIQQVNEGIDTGNIILQRTIPITQRDTTNSLKEKAGKIGVEMLVEAIQAIKSNRAYPVIQKKIGYTYTLPTLWQWIQFQLKMFKRRLKRV